MSERLKVRISNFKFGIPVSATVLKHLSEFNVISCGHGDLGKAAGVKRNQRGRTDLQYNKNGKLVQPFLRFIARLK